MKGGYILKVFNRENFHIKTAKGKYLDNIGYILGVERKHQKVFFGLITIKESDKSFRSRMAERMRLV